MFFCAWCFHYYTDSTEACHRHVRACPENPHPGAVYGDYVHWDQVHAPRKRSRSVYAASALVRAEIKEVLRRINERRDALVG